MNRLTELLLIAFAVAGGFTCALGFAVSVGIVSPARSRAAAERLFLTMIVCAVALVISIGSTR